MPSLDDILDSPVSSVGKMFDGRESPLAPGTIANLGPYKKVPGVVDPRLKLLSYSSENTLYECPQKYRLYKLRVHSTEDAIFQSISNAFGHSCGLAAQMIFQEHQFSLHDVLWAQFLQWPENIPLAMEDEKAKKGFFYANLYAAKLYYARRNGFLRDWVIVDYNGKPAIELGFEILLPNGFRYRGFIDAVLRNRITNALGVLEHKTTKYTTIDPAQYKNSGQSVGYSIVLDHIDPDLSSYEVLYLIYSSTSMEITPLEFTKSLAQRAEWIQTLLFNIQNIQMYDEAGVYPRRGESCFNFFRQCQYFQTCTMSIERLAKEYTPEMIPPEKYDVVVTLEELVETQLRRFG